MVCSFKAFPSFWKNELFLSSVESLSHLVLLLGDVLGVYSLKIWSQIKYFSLDKLFFIQCNKNIHSIKSIKSVSLGYIKISVSSLPLWDASLDNRTSSLCENDIGLDNLLSSWLAFFRKSRIWLFSLAKKKKKMHSDRSKSISKLKRCKHRQLCSTVES